MEKENAPNQTLEQLHARRLGEGPERGTEVGLTLGAAEGSAEGVTGLVGSSRGGVWTGGSEAEVVGPDDRCALLRRDHFCRPKHIISDALMMKPNQIIYFNLRQ